MDMLWSMNGTPPSKYSAGRQLLALLGWLGLCFAAAGSAAFISPGSWYAGLHKPSWNPPAWIFGPVWTLLYVLMAVAAWLVWRAGGWRRQGRALGLFLLQWLLNFLWTPVFFGLHHMLLAFVDIMALWIVLVAAVISFWRIRTVAGLLLVPYVAWVTFAAVLNFTLWRLNSVGP